MTGPVHTYPGRVYWATSANRADWVEGCWVEIGRTADDGAGIVYDPAPAIAPLSTIRVWKQTARSAQMFKLLYDSLMFGPAAFGFGLVAARRRRARLSRMHSAYWARRRR